MLQNIFQEFKLTKEISLKNRIVMAPLTRCFADQDLTPTKLMKEYYVRRADVGLIITEATIISPRAQGYPNTPGIFNQKQIDAWKEITDCIHQKGGKIFMQLWHVGRQSHSSYHNGELPLAPSAIGLSGKVPRTDFEYEIPKAMSKEEISQTVKDYSQAAKNAIEAGFDGVEIHGANGYLIDQFLHQASNKRDDEYGTDTTGRLKFAIDVIEGIIQSIGSKKVGVRLSPGSYFHQEHTAGDEVTYQRLLEFLNKKDIAYVHTGIFDDSTQFEYLKGNVTSFLRKYYKGTIIASGSYTALEGNTAIDENKFDLLAIGRALIANPDYITRLESGEKMKDYHTDMLTTLF